MVTGRYLPNICIIYGQTWYFKLIRQTDKNNRGLYDIYDPKHISNNGIYVCYEPKYINNQRFIDKDRKNRRLYTYFDSHVAFYNYMNKFKRKERNFHEVIPGDRSQKPRFDIDMVETKSNEGVDVQIKDKIIDIVIEILGDLGYTINIEKDILIYSSHGTSGSGKKKRSFHIIINNYFHNKSDDAKGFYYKVINQIPEEWRQYIDKGVYKKNQNFRMVFSTKNDAYRPKCYHSKFLYNNELYTHILNDEKDVDESLIILYESLLTFCHYSQSLPSFKIKKKYTGECSEISEEKAEKIVYMIKCRIPDFPYRYEKIIKNSLFFKRTRAAECVLCNKGSPHTSQNSFAFMIEETVYWKCWQSNRSLKIGYIFDDNRTMLSQNTIEKDKESDVRGGTLNFDYSDSSEDEDDEEEILIEDSESEDEKEEEVLVEDDDSGSSDDKKSSKSKKSKDKKHKSITSKAKKDTKEQMRINLVESVNKMLKEEKGGNARSRKVSIEPGSLTSLLYGDD